MNPEIKQTPNIYLDIIADCKGQVREINAKINIITENSPCKASGNTPDVATRSILEEALVNLYRELKSLKESIIV